MAVFLNNGCQVTVKSVALTDHVTSVTLNRTFDELEVTAMGDSGHKFVKGLEASSVTIVVGRYIRIGWADHDAVHDRGCRRKTKD